MRVDQIHKLFSEYADEFETGMHVADEVLRLLQTNDNIKADIEASITAEWLERVKEVGKFYVISEMVTRNGVPIEIIERRSSSTSKGVFPYIQTTYMDFADVSNRTEKTVESKVPSIRLCREKILVRGYNSDKALGRYVDEAR